MANRRRRVSGANSRRKWDCASPAIPSSSPSTRAGRAGRQTSSHSTVCVTQKSSSGQIWKSATCFSGRAVASSLRRHRIDRTTHRRTFRRCAARAVLVMYLDAIPGRGCIRERIRELLDVETYDSVQKVGQRYFFRKRLPGQEQFGIYLRDGAQGTDQLLLDPAERGTGPYTALKPLRVSPDGKLLLYEVKEGGERTGTFELFDIEGRVGLPDALPSGYLRGFAFARDSKSFYYVHESSSTKRPHSRAAFQHVLGTSFEDDKEIFSPGEERDVRLLMVPGAKHLGFLVLHFDDITLTDFYIWSMGSRNPPAWIIRQAKYKFGPLFVEDGRILAITDLDAPNFRIVEVRPIPDQEPEFRNVVPRDRMPSFRTGPSPTGRFSFPISVTSKPKL